MKDNEFYEKLEDGFFVPTDCTSKRKPKSIIEVKKEPEPERLTAVEAIGEYIKQGYSDKVAKAAVAWMADEGCYHSGFTLKQIEWTMKNGGFAK